MKIAIGIAALILMAALTALAIEAVFLLRETRLKEDAVAGEMAGWDWGVKNDLGQIAAATKVVAQVGAQERAAFAEQDRYYVQLGIDTDETLREIRDDTIPKLSVVLDRSSDAITSGSTTFNRFADQGTEDLAEADATIRSLQQPIERIGDDAAAIGTGIQAINGTAANVESTTADIKNFVHRETAPIRGTFNIIKAFLMEFAGPAAEVATSIK